ncbi:sugar-binding domain-containing protein [Microbulbifer agarilyticus]|uniref:sugar-binding domain-containing protein n=1 Tax=Microbulbifer agarilyticus TaxID=260552 RepID=UPI001CD63F01|nr:sugar-binding domain-containing protein [Microbulbifer agarilyticus]MCA0892147.1 DUF4982 domain-containing protein [Microbulbifer agarilyticus]
MKKFCAKLLVVFLTFTTLSACSSDRPVHGEAEARTRVNFDFNWKFFLGDAPTAKETAFDDAQWRSLNVPHDWSIEGEYDKNNPAGIAGGFLPTGTGWYRKHFDWQEAWQGKRVYIEFDGVYMNSEVWVNGHYLGKRPYGYVSFQYDLTDYLTPQNNVIAVRVDNANAPSGRWYTGSGIYRHVWLTTVNQQHVPYSGVFVRGENVTREKADVRVTTEVVNHDQADKTLTLLSELVAPNGEVSAKSRREVEVAAGSTYAAEQAFELLTPELWSVDAPHLYQLKTTVSDGGQVVDRLVTSTGFRSVDISVDRGFVLNGEPIVLQGISMHHDGGPVGAAVPDDVLRKRLIQLKEMGVNAIRTTHNPFAPEFYQMANEMGFLLMNEAFDGWWDAKAKYDYGLYFDEWWQRDLTDFMRRDRNHPSVVMWSVGNEVPNYTPEQQKQLVAFASSIDDSRPITQGRGYAGGHLTIAGFNGHGEFKGAIEKFHEEYPDTPVIGTEMTHTIHTRGVYRSKTSYRVRDFPAPWEVNSKEGPAKKWQRIKNKVYKIPNLTEEEVFPSIDGAYGSSYDNSVVRMPIRDEIRLARELPYLLGTFRWTAFDYLGESFGWPARTANFGVIDLAGFPKGPYYLYQSQWSSEPMVHLDPHWTHPGKEGVEIPVVVYTNQPSAEVFLNGESLGEKAMGDAMQLVWLVPYEAGELTVVAKNGSEEVVRKSVRSAGAPASVAISIDRTEITANQTDVVHVELDVVDDQGNMVPSASNRLNIAVEGAARLIGVENGDILDLEPHKVPTRKAFMGKALALLQATDQPGPITVTVSSEGLEPRTISLNSI